MSTVSATTLLGSLVDLDMLNDEVTRIQALCIRVRLSVLKEGEEMFSRFDRPSGAGDTELLSYITVSSEFTFQTSDLGSRVQTNLEQHDLFLLHIVSSG